MAAIVSFAAIAPAAGAAITGSASWPVAGQGASDNRYQPDETAITAGNVNQLSPKWVFTTHGDVSATPTEANGVVYFPDWGGYMYAVNASTGQQLWATQISSYDGVAGAISRNSPAIVYDSAIGGDELIVGDNLSSLGAHSTGAHVFGVNASNGALLWSTQVDSSQAAIITGSPTQVGTDVVVGVSSNEEALAETDGYACCTFRGSVVALNPTNGRIVWKTYTVPANLGPCRSADPELGCSYSGDAVWSTPAYDASTNMIYVGTGNNYTTPTLPRICDRLTTLLGRSNANCTPADDYFDAVVGINASTGKIVWGKKVEGWDAFTIACANHLPGVTWCPSPESPDYDFGSGPNLITATVNGTSETLVGVGQKSGVYWAFNPTTGAIVWSTLVGPGSSLGGTMWGTAYDGTSIYVPISNGYNKSFKLVDGTTTTDGAWSALNPSTGALEWQTAVPGVDNDAMGPVSAADGVVFAGSSAGTGDNMFALDGSTGAILWSFASGGSAVSSPAIVDGNVFWGSGYSLYSSLGFTGNDKLYDFTLGGS